MKNDEELNNVLRDMTIASGGVLLNIQCIVVLRLLCWRFVFVSILVSHCALLSIFCFSFIDSAILLTKKTLTNKKASKPNQDY